MRGIRRRMAEQERVLAVVPSAVMGVAVYELSLTDRRLVATRVGRLSDVAMVGIAAYVMMKRLPPDETVDLRGRYEGLSLDESLGVDPANFEVPYGEIQRASLRTSRRGASLALQTIRPDSRTRTYRLRWRSLKGLPDPSVEVEAILRGRLGPRLRL